MAGYERHECGGEVVDGEPHYIPLGTDSILRIVDQKCLKCGAIIIGPHQKRKMIQNREAHDKLVDIMMGIHKKAYDAVTEN